MANENMIKFLRGSVANLPQTATAGTLYFTEDEGLYLGLDDGTYHRYGDFIIVANVNALPETGAHDTCMYYCVAENILAKYDATEGWIQINKQPTAEEMKTLLGLGTAAYTDANAYDAAGAAQEVRTYVGDIPETATATNIVAYIQEKTAGIATDTALEELTGRVATAEGEIDALQADIVKKVGSVGAGDNSVTIGGTATNPTVAVKLSAAEGNALELAADGLKVIIPESTKVEDSETNGNIKVDGEEVKVFDDVFGIDMVTVNALGGISAGTNLKDKTLHEILNDLLFPYVKPAVATPTRVPNTTAALEKGDDQVVTSVSAKITKKSKSIVKVELYKGSELIATKEGDDLPNITTSGTTVTFSNLSVAVPSSSVTFTVKAIDADGGSTTSGASAGWTFVYPYFYGVCAGDKTAATLTEADIEAMTKDIKSKGEKSYTYTTNNQKMVIAYPKAHGVLKKALDPNGFDYLGDYDRAELSITGLDGTAQAYYVYAQKAPSFVTSFTMKFQY